MKRGGIDVALAELGRLEQTLAELDVLPRRVAVEAAPALTELLAREFSQGVNPYGQRWRKLATGKRSYLTETSRLRDGTRAVPMFGGRAGIRIILGASYGGFHQTGTRNMPARKILPERGMPRAWRDAIDAAAKRAFRKAVRR